jgi:Na+/H+ antiporter NhaD/arsenite permease-like protein
MEEVKLVPATVALVIFLITYTVILAGWGRRTVVALFGAVAMVGAGHWFSFYPASAAVGTIDSNTISLLLGMMIVVAMFQGTGFFQYLAIKAAKLARGKPWLLFVYLGLVTAVLSAVLDNVTTVLILVPVTVSVTEILGLPVVPFLLGEVLSSNIGGTATLIGDPPNILIGSAAHFSFNEFLTHITPIVIVAWIVAQGVLLLVFRSSLRGKPENVDRLMAMDERSAIVDRRTMRRMLVVLGGTILLFFLQRLIGLDPGWIALLGACVGLLWIRPDFDQVLKAVEWDVLLFFAALFIVVGGLEAAGLLSLVGRGVLGFTSHGMLLVALVLLWGGALLAGVVSNVPLTIALSPVLISLRGYGVDVAPLFWALALGVGLGANLTPIAAAANVVVVRMSEKMGKRIGFREWLPSGTAATLTTLAVASVGLALAMAWGIM